MPRLLGGFLAASLAVLLLGTTVVAGLHHHAALEGHATCAVCSVAHTPAISVDALAAPRRVAVVEQDLVAAPDVARSQATPRAPSTRGPPLS